MTVREERSVKDATGVSLFSFFAGSGIMDLAFEEAGYEVVYVNEYDTSFLAAYQYARVQIGIRPPRYGYDNVDIRMILNDRSALEEHMRLERDRGRIVGFIGGPPCPDFSVAGKNRGIDGVNGQLTAIFFELITKCEPDFFIFENVRGLVKTAKHKSFYNEQKRKIKEKFLIDDRLLNSLEYGVPQSRARVILIGVFRYLGQGSLQKDCVITRDGEKELHFDWDARKLYRLDNIASCSWPTTQPFVENSKRYFVYDKEYRSLTVDYWFKKNDVVNHPNGKDCFLVKGGRAKIESIQEGDVSRKSFKRLHRHRYSPTAAYGNNEVHLHPYKARRLSVAEVMAIQSLPASFELPAEMTLSKKFKTIGNGVPYLMARAIALTLRDLLCIRGGGDGSKTIDI